MDLEKTKKFLKENNIKAELIEHKEDGLTSENAAKATGIDLNHIIKVLCFVDSKEKKAFVIIQGNKRVDAKKHSWIKEAENG